MEVSPNNLSHAQPVRGPAGNRDATLEIKKAE
jgi:hypothetical protein